ncbi:crosslink repair DNA glycosylase YcaQ family protein [Actinotalea sp. AC32]|nr:crosslink repair DNA glycosylase YcaQ family protein [Actinotalea sp. AC32]
MPASRPSPVRTSSSVAPRTTTTLSLAQARRVALRAQGLDRPRRTGGTVTMRHLEALVDRLGLLQIDSVNVLARAHLVPVFSRLGPYDTGLVPRAAGVAPRRLVEAWAHQASYVPPRTYRLLGWRQRAYLEESWGMIADVPLRHAAVVTEVLDLVRSRGPVTAREVHAVLEHVHPHVREGWWSWSVAKRVLEFLFFTGQVTAAGRNAAFERCYDLTERVLPPEVLATPEPSDADAVRELVEIGARAHGIGTVRCFADYFRVRGPAVRRAVDELVESGTLVPVEVEGWDRPTYLHRDATTARRAEGRALLSPFDPLVFERSRLEALFDVRYRIEIYVPAPQRTYGYYVLPFLLGDRFAARVDLKADRASRRLLVPGAFAEDAAPATTVDELVDELRLLARWLDLDDVVVPGDARGDLAPALRGELAR